MPDDNQATDPHDPDPEEAACVQCGRTAEIEVLADSCDRPDCPLNALFDRLPILQEKTDG